MLLNYFIKISCNFIYFFLKFRKTKSNKIVFISRLSDNKSLDFSLIEDELRSRNSNLEIVFLCKRITSMSSDLFGNIKYTFSCLYHLSNSSRCITDSYVPAISCVKHKKDIVIIQLWHSMGAIKKFAYQTLDCESGRDKNTARILNMHKNYNYIISGSKEMTKYFSLAFNYDKKYFVNYGLPRMDYLLKNKDLIREKIYKEYPSLKEKKIILYAPTFRTTNDDNTSILIRNINFDKYNLIIKSHERQKLKNNSGILTCPKFSALDLLCVCDYLITDYSGIAIEGAMIDVKTLYYVFDYDKYKQNNGLNIDLYKEMPGCVFESSKDLCNKINSGKYDMSVLKKYKDKYIDVKDGTSTKKIVDLILRGM